jgi:flagellar hook-associated protein 1 FlgK
MGLFANLQSSLNALNAFQQSLTVAQNNVSNASTPGYAAQLATLDALPFQAQTGLTGGVQAGAPVSTRDEYLEQAVQYQQSNLGSYTAQSQALSGIQPLFDVTGQSGIVAGLNNMFQSFSAWSASPDSAAAQQNVLTSAQDLGMSFQQAAATLSSVTSNVNNNIDSTVSQINTLATQVVNYNLQQAQTGGTANTGLDANLHNTLETLSGLAGITARFESDGSVTLLMGGQTPLVIGTHQYSIQSSYSGTANPVNPNAPPAAHIVDANGQDVTANVVGGTLGGLLTVRNTVLPSLQGDGQQAGALNQIAKQVADRVNQILATGLDSNGNPGTPLFTYDHDQPEHHHQYPGGARPGSAAGSQRDRINAFQFRQFDGGRGYHRRQIYSGLPERANPNHRAAGGQRNFRSDRSPAVRDAGSSSANPAIGCFAGWRSHRHHGPPAWLPGRFEDDHRN